MKQANQDYNDKYRVSTYGYSLRYGNFSVVTVCLVKYYRGKNSVDDVVNHAEQVISSWKDFEEAITKYPSNSAYFRDYEDSDTLEKRSEVNFEGYYKGKTLNLDLITYFGLVRG